MEINNLVLPGGNDNSNSFFFFFKKPFHPDLVFKQKT